jgi:hypothetical protein
LVELFYPFSMLRRCSQIQLPRLNSIAAVFPSFHAADRMRLLAGTLPLADTALAEMRTSHPDLVLVQYSPSQLRASAAQIALHQDGVPGDGKIN